MKFLNRLFFTILLGVFTALLIFGLILYNQKARPLWYLTGKISDQGTYLVYLPDGLESGKKYTTVFLLSPSADAMGMISTWSQIAEKHRWILAASKEFHNGVEFGLTLQQLGIELRDFEQKYAVDPRRLIFSGISGGGMGSHAMSKFYPREVSAVVINTGMMEESFMTSDYPQGKLAVFLASPTDFRYHEMQRDHSFLLSHRWKVKWIEFPGGHIMAPLEIYEQAATWLEENLH
jgi:predicted esterase